MRDWKKYLFSLAVLILCVSFFVTFLRFHEDRVEINGWRFEDPLFPFLPRQNLSLLIFTCTYSSLILYFALCYKQAHFIIKLLLTYSVILLFRMVTLSIVPLREPLDLIFLEDPFLNDLIYPGRIVRDLFFSGHTALIFSMFLLSGKKLVFLILTIVVGLSLMIQRVHFSIDVFAAIPFAYLAVFVVKNILSHRLFDGKG
jgi:membrane-associated phospholipid phosphatase